MASYNRIIIAGNLTRDPEYKQLPSGQAVTRLGLASNRNYKNRQTGDMVQEVCFVDIDVFGPQAESCNQYLQKGRAVLIEGRLKFDTWQNPEGQMRSKHAIVADRVVFLASQAANDSQEQQVPKEPQDPMVAEAHAKVQKVKAAQKAVSEKKEKAPAEQNDEDSGEFDFKDEPPFEDDLPF